MNETICVLDVKIDNCSAKQAMKTSVEYMSTAVTNVVELVTIETLMSVRDMPDLKNAIEQSSGTGGDSRGGGHCGCEAYSGDRDPDLY